jgi:hypothetical protein
MKKTSKYFGVSWNESKRLWLAYVIIGDLQVHLCYSESDIKAAHVRDYAVSLLNGSRAKLNFSHPSLPSGVSPILVRSRLRDRGILD